MDAFVFLPPQWWQITADELFYDAKNKDYFRLTYYRTNMSSNFLLKKSTYRAIIKTEKEQPPHKVVSLKE